VADVSSRSVALSATACPAARNFSFCIEHQVAAVVCRLWRVQGIWRVAYKPPAPDFTIATLLNLSYWSPPQNHRAAGGVQPVPAADAPAGAVHAPQPGAARGRGRGRAPQHAVPAAGPPAGERNSRGCVTPPPTPREQHQSYVRQNFRHLRSSCVCSHMRCLAVRALEWTAR
jgi:hypothetical protein